MSFLLNLEITVDLDTDENGKLAIQTRTCTSDIDNFTTQFQGTASSFFDSHFDTLWDSENQRSLEAGVCDAITGKIDEFKWLHDVFDGMRTQYDCVIISTPVTSPQYIDLNLHCAHHHKTSVSERYSTPPLEVAEPDNSRMFHLWISEETINRQAKSLVAAYTQDRMLTKSRLPEGYKTLLDIECPDAEFICIGNLLEFFDLLPADKNKRPTSTVVELTPTYVSDVHVSRDRLDMDMVLKIRVAPNDNHKTTLLDAEFHVTLVCDVRFDTTDGTLTLAYEFIKFDAQLTHISADIPLDTINNLIKMMLKQYPEYFQGTWAIPELLESAGVKVIKPTAELLPGMVYLAWDF